MRKKLILILMTATLLFCGCSKNETNNFVLVKGKESAEVSIPDFYIGKYEVTQKEWTEVMGSNPSGFKGEDLPVEMVSWYDCIDYCNKRSEKEGLTPYYKIDKKNKDLENQSVYDDIKWVVTVNEEGNGYRLPTETEWIYAASGGLKSKQQYTYSGSNEEEEVLWYWRNAGKEFLSGDWNWSSIEANKNQTHPVGSKKPNELGLYDMSGNVREWCYDWYEDDKIPSGQYRVWKGGGWIGDATSCEVSYHGKYEANGTGSDQGFRICRNK